MSASRLYLVSPERVAEYVRAGPVRDAMAEIARLAGAELTPLPPHPDSVCDAPPESLNEIPIRYRQELRGRTIYRRDGGEAVERAARAVASLTEHLLDREEAVEDLAEAMITSYEELNMLYALLPRIVTTVHASDIGEAIVSEASRTLRCRRVSLLVLNEERTSFRVLASRGLPVSVRNISIPVRSSIAGSVLIHDDLLVVDNIDARPDLAELSVGTYEAPAFAVVRVPLRAQGEPLGILTATERQDGGEFTARDRKLLEGLSAVGASALLNCRLHAAVHRQMMNTIQALASAVDAKDHYTHDHSGRVAQLSVATARELGITDDATCREIEMAGLLHDIGKIGLADAILSKGGGLTAQEFAIVRTHVQIGASIVEHVEGLANVAKAILHHHERYDGLGYPGWLAGEAIPLASRLIATADAYDSLTSDRPYRAAVAPEAAIEELIRCKGTQFDPAVVEAFLAVVQRETRVLEPACV